MKKLILSAILGLAILVSCEKKQETVTDENNNMAKTERNASEEHATEDHEKSEDHDKSVKLELNKGEKWPVNNEMKPFITETETLLNSYKPENGDYKMLATNLNAANEKLVKSCTMTGTPHENLHVWLAPHMKEIEKLQKADNREDANKIVGELKESMEKYHEYFN
ncbi:hypothetical protein IV494_06130 [Kaistella sp. G5-32]|uniref:Lipoprotein n=1 Tax=Kaistella gelatinilytica TaxID=2787636 RepID=A0ABS0FAN6_9FLAO|nr:hypothetical protein [Kaistella gelatinilytica]MBF8456757.1 hypothetical protein [Kaistella gelatinilytica]